MGFHVATLEGFFITKDLESFRLKMSVWVDKEFDARHLVQYALYRAFEQFVLDAAGCESSQIPDLIRAHHEQHKEHLIICVSRISRDMTPGSQQWDQTTTSS